MKFVAFVDVLGFRKKIQTIDHVEAVQLIKKFNQIIFNLWSEGKFKDKSKIKGRTFSDSFIIWSASDSVNELILILDFLIELYKRAFIECDFLLRGGLAVGEYYDHRATEFNNLNKAVMVGNGFIDAYLIESSFHIKGSKILFGENIFNIIETANELNDYRCRLKEVTRDSKIIYEIRWEDAQFLVMDNFAGLIKFVSLACDSDWLDHYFKTMDVFLIGESQSFKLRIFEKIIEIINEHFDFKMLDLFIENFLKCDNSVIMKKSFLAFLRKKIK